MSTAWKQEFSKKFLSLIKHKNRYELFRDWAHLSAIACQQTPVNLGVLPKSEAYERLESLYMERIKAYDAHTLKVFSEMLGVVNIALAEAKTDFLGEMYEELEISSQKDSGQFFTPYSVAKMIAETNITADFLSEVIERNGCVTIAEPAVGAGSLLIAATSVIENLGFNPQNQMYFEGVDVDRLCCDLSYIQMSVMGTVGFIIHGNSLSCEYWDARPTPRLQILQKYEEVNPIYKISQMLLGIERDISLTKAQEEVCEVISKQEIKGYEESRQLNLFEDL